MVTKLFPVNFSFASSSLNVGLALTRVRLDAAKNGEQIVARGLERIVSFEDARGT
jgi:hypothetical protein